MALYTPGNEPESIKKRLMSFFARIDEYYPDKVIAGLHNDHKKLGERLSALYKELGYSSGQEMMEAYGYTYVQKTRGAVYTQDELAQKKSELLEKLRQLAEAESFKNVADLKRCHPEFEKDIVRLKISAAELAEHGITKSNKPDEKAETVRKKKEKKNEIPEQNIHRNRCTPKKDKTNENNSVSAFLRCLVTGNSKSEKSISQSEFGLSYSTLKERYERYMPQTMKYRAFIQLLKDIPVTSEGILIEESLNADMRERIISAAKDMGYDSDTEFLCAFGIKTDNTQV